MTLYVPPGRTEEGIFARDKGVRAFDFFCELFQVAYPLPKLDLICLPQMHGVGMEGFGAVTILQEYFLVDASTDYVRKRRIFRSGSSRRPSCLCHAS